jgi:hypothetical protein
MEWIGATLFVAVAGIYCFSAPPADNDLWGHVHFGRAILAARQLPATNEYSYTAPDHPWINHEILAECMFAATYGYFGSPGLLVLKLLVGLATLALMAKSAFGRTSAPLAWAGALFVSASLMAWGYLVRPQIFTFLGLAFVWDRILAHDARRRWHELAVLPPVFALWINTHGGVVAGLAILLAYVAIRLLSRQTAAERLTLAALAVLSVAALALNPYGLELPAFLLRDLSRSRPISEWQPIPLFDLSTPLFKSIVLILAAGALVSRGRRGWELLLLGLAAAATFRHQRHLPLFAILAAPRLTETLNDLWGWLRRRARLASFSPLARSLLAAGLAAIGAFEIFRIATIYRNQHFQILVSPEQFPVDAVRFIERNRLAGNLAVPFDWGEYAIWHLHQRCRVSIDGRYTTAYPDEVLAESERFFTGAPGWDTILVHADLALIDRRQPIVARMFQEPDWQYVYSDQAALVFVRKNLADSRSFVRKWRTEPEGAFFFP